MDAESYYIVLAELGSAAEDVWFFEYTAVNIHAARNIGLTVHPVDRSVGVLPVLRRVALIPD